MEIKKVLPWRPKGSWIEASFGLHTWDLLLPSRSLQEGIQARDQGALLGVKKRGFAGLGEVLKERRIPDLGVHIEGRRRVLLWL